MAGPDRAEMMLQVALLEYLIRRIIRITQKS